MPVVAELAQNVVCYVSPARLAAPHDLKTDRVTTLHEVEIADVGQLVEVPLGLESINEACANERRAKSAVDGAVVRSSDAREALERLLCRVPPPGFEPRFLVPSVLPARIRPSSLVPTRSSAVCLVESTYPPSA